VTGAAPGSSGGASRVFVAPVSFGLGDLVVSLPVVQALVSEGARSGRETWLITRSGVQERLAERIDGLAGTVSEAEVAAGRDDVLVDLRDHPLQRDHWWGTPEFTAAHGDLSINAIIDRIASDLGVAADFTTPAPLTARHRPDVGDLVLLVTAADGAAKRWLPDRWGELAGLFGSRGIDAAVVTRDGCHDAVVDQGLSRIEAPSVGDAVDVLTSCRAVVGVDTGLTHIAAQQGTPTVTLSRMPAVYFRDWEHTRLVAGSACDPECRRLEAEYAYNHRVDLTGVHPAPRVCPARARCLEPVRPPDVLRALTALC
jgi:Glycosyltransferase family 9 (heptosyltransferase)